MKAKRLKSQLLRSVFYVRVSDDQEGESTSTEDQERAIRVWADKNGVEIIRGYCDYGIDGKTIWRRPGMRQLLTDARERGDFEQVIVFNFDRLARHLAPMADIFTELSAVGVRLFSLKDGDGTQIAILLKMLFNTMFMESLAANVTRGMVARAEKGLNLSRPPIGWKVDPARPGHLILDETYSPLVKDAHESLQRGETLTSIIARWNAKGYRTPKGNLFQVRHLTGGKLTHGILTQPRAYGVSAWNRTYVELDDKEKTIKVVAKDEDEWIIKPTEDDALITKECFDRTQEILQKTRRAINRQAGKQRLLSGLLKCDQCSSTMMIHGRDYNGRNRIRCHNNRSNGGCSNNRTFYLEEAERMVVEALANKLKEPEFIEPFMRAYNEERATLIAAYNQEHGSSAKRLKAVEAKIARLVDLASEGVVRGEDLQNQLGPLYRERDTLTRAIEALENSPVKIEMNPASTSMFGDILNQLKEGDDLPYHERLDKVSLARFRSLIDKIVVKPHPKGFSLEVTGLLGAVACHPRSEAAMVLVSKSYKKSELKGRLKTSILTILDLTFSFEILPD